MNFKHCILCLGMAGMIGIPATQVEADGKDAALGFIAGVVTNQVINNQRKKTYVAPKKTYTKKSTKPAISTAQRQQNQDIQTSLNYFNYPVGGVDGVLGKNSRAAIRNFQADMGFAPDGYLDDFERQFLIASYHRARGGAIGPYSQVMAAYGPKGLLRAYRGEQTGINPYPNLGGTQTMMAGAQAPMTVPNAVTAGQVGVPGTAVAMGAGAVGAAGTMAVAQPAPVAAAPVAPNLTPVAVTQAPAVGGLNPIGAAPALMPLDAGPTTVSEFCASTAARTQANGGLMNAGNLSDPAQALDEQFCKARDYVIADGVAAAQTVSDHTPEAMKALCGRIGQALAPSVTMMSTASTEDVIAKALETIDATGNTAASFQKTSKICLNFAYSADNSEEALASALLLVAGGQLPYSELIGHHLREGLGVTANAELATAWQKIALDAVESGTAAPTILADRQVERGALMRMALGASGTTPPKQDAGAGLPELQLTVMPIE